MGCTGSEESDGRRIVFGAPRAPGPRLALGAVAGGWGMNLGEQLCPARGLCCDGTLFDNVQLGAGDDAQKLKALRPPVAVTRGQTQRKAA